MTDTDKKQSTQTWLAGLLLLLVAIVGIQAWYMVGMKEQLSAIHDQQVTAKPAMQKETETAATTRPVTITKAAPVAVATAQTVAQQAQAASPGSQPQMPARPQTRPLPHSLFDDDFFNSAPYDAQTWNPYEEIQRMQRDMDRMFNNAFSRFNTSPDFQHLFREGFTTPEMDVQEDDHKYTVIVNLPGSSEENVSVNLNGQTLTVKGEQKFEKLDKDGQGNIIFQERRSGSFQRSITLPGPVKQAGMKTNIDNGVLTITIPKDV